MSEVQSMILNLSFPHDFADVKALALQGETLHVETLIASNGHNDVIHSWTASKWIKPDDIVFFMFSKSSIHTIIRLKRQLIREQDKYKDIYHMIMNVLDRGEELYKKIGGSIFMIGRVCDTPFYDDPSAIDHTVFWTSKRYAYVDNYFLLGKPIPLAEFDGFIKLSCGGTITPIYGDKFEHLKNLVSQRNRIPDYLKNSTAMPIPLVGINRDNWLELASRHRRRFIYEDQFRCFYVDYFLKELGDQRTIYRECACRKDNLYPSAVDNVIKFNNRFLPVEVKLSVASEKNINQQLKKYCHLDSLCLDKTIKRMAPKDRVYDDYVLVIDTFAVYLYNFADDSVSKILDLDELIELADIERVRQILINLLT